MVLLDLTSILDLREGRAPTLVVPGWHAVMEEKYPKRREDGVGGGGQRQQMHMKSTKLSCFTSDV